MGHFERLVGYGGFHTGVALCRRPGIRLPLLTMSWYVRRWRGRDAGVRRDLQTSHAGSSFYQHKLFAGTEMPMFWIGSNARDALLLQGRW